MEPSELQLLKEDKANFVLNMLIAAELDSFHSEENFNRLMKLSDERLSLLESFVQDAVPKHQLLQVMMILGLKG